MQPANGRHPVEYLFDSLNDIDYPDKLIPATERISGTAFFPGGFGLWRQDGGALPPMPCGGVMVLGQDFGTSRDFRRALRVGNELHTPTWRNLLRLLEGAAVSPKQCFFTNAYMGLRTGDSSTGPSPGATDQRFRERCALFLDEQIAVQQPRLILALGLMAADLIASVSSDLAAWRKGSGAWGWEDLYAAGPLQLVRFGKNREARVTVVALLHPSGYNLGNNLARRRYREHTGREAELALLREAVENAEDVGARVKLSPPRPGS